MRHNIRKLTFAHESENLNKSAPLYFVAFFYGLFNAFFLGVVLAFIYALFMLGFNFFQSVFSFIKNIILLF